MKTYIVVGHHELSGKQYHHGDELPPGLLADELLDYWLDKKMAAELDDTERRSLHLLFAPFSGTKQTAPIELDKELAQYLV